MQLDIEGQFGSSVSLGFATNQAALALAVSDGSSLGVELRLVFIDGVWILASGVWNDAGVWDDTANWSDAA